MQSLIYEPLPENSFASLITRFEFENNLNSSSILSEDELQETQTQLESKSDIKKVVNKKISKKPKQQKKSKFVKQNDKERQQKHTCNRNLVKILINALQNHIKQQEYDETSALKNIVKSKLMKPGQQGNERIMNSHIKQLKNILKNTPLYKWDQVRENLLFNNQKIVNFQNQQQKYCYVLGLLLKEFFLNHFMSYMYSKKVHQISNKNVQYYIELKDVIKKNLFYF